MNFNPQKMYNFYLYEYRNGDVIFKHSRANYIKCYNDIRNGNITYNVSASNTALDGLIAVAECNDRRYYLIIDVGSDYIISDDDNDGFDLRELIYITLYEDNVVCSNVRLFDVLKSLYNADITYKATEVSCDHQPFKEKGLVAIAICDNGHFKLYYQVDIG